MKKKIFLNLALGLILLVIAAVVVTALCLDKIVKAGMEAAGPKITQTSLTVASVNLSLLSGAAAINGLVLGNPAGYKSASAISLGKAAISLAPGSILSDKIIIHSIELRAPEITLEGNPLGENNLTKIMANVNAMAGGGAPASPGAPAAKKPAKKLQVDDFLISGAKVHANITGLPGLPAQEVTVPIPDIHFSGLGQGSDGITAAELTQKVLQQITAGTLQAVADYARNMASGAAGGLLKAATNSGLDKISKGLGGFFKK